MKRISGSFMTATLIALIGTGVISTSAAAQTAAPAAQATPAATPAKAKSASQPSTTPLDLNAASEADLIALPGVGPATAKKIIAGRPYKSVDDLKKAGVSAAALAKMAPLVTVKAAAAAAGATAVAQPARPASPPVATPSATTAQQAPAKGMVWVNLNTKVFHREGDRWYGKTRSGQFMTEADALKAGYHEAKPGAAKAKS